MSDQPDEYLLGQVRDALATDVGELELRVGLSNGRIVVSGTVPTDHRRLEVEEAVRRVADGREVINETSVVDTEASPAEERIE